jgi:hypothetical protein
VLLSLAVAGTANASGEAKKVVAFLLEAPLVLTAGWLSFRATTRRLPGAVARTAVVRMACALLALLALGQMVKKKQTYPLVAFTMYGDAHEEPVSFYWYEATLRSGRRERFRPSTVVSSLGSARILRGLAQRLDAIDGAPAADAGPKRQQLVDTLRALIRLHNDRHSEDPVDAVSVYGVRLPPPFDVRYKEQRHIVRVTAQAT